jgi:hypothetical protein
LSCPFEGNPSIAHIVIFLVGAAQIEVPGEGMRGYRFQQFDGLSVIPTAIGLVRLIEAAITLGIQNLEEQEKIING